MRAADLNVDTWILLGVDALHRSGEQPRARVPVVARRCLHHRWARPDVALDKEVGSRE